MSQITNLDNIGRIGLGCMGMSEFYGEISEQDAVSALNSAIEIGYRHFDTADMYGIGGNERLLGKFLRDMPLSRDEVFISTKVGIVRKEETPNQIAVDSSPEYILSACEKSLERLGVESIDLYYLHRRNADVPIDETWGAMKQLVSDGKVKSLGVSEASAETLLEAHAISPITAIQSEYSLWSRDVENGMIDVCRDNGIKLIAYSPLGRGFLSGNVSQESIQKAGDLRQRLPRFQPEAFSSNLKLLDALQEIANKVNASKAQVALAWLLHQQPFLHLIPGAKKLNHMQDNFAAKDIQLSDEDASYLSNSFNKENISGDRYPQELLKTINY